MAGPKWGNVHEHEQTPHCTVASSGNCAESTENMNVKLPQLYMLLILAVCAAYIWQMW